VAFQAEPKTTSKIWVANQFEQTLRDLGTDHIDMNWVLSKHYVTAAIPGMTERSHLELNVQTLSSMA
jgi:aryl-alcohol dehydrogenase-like predicted oxidoreductase